MKKWILPTLAIILLVGCSRRGENELWLVPEGHTGWLVIVPNQRDGVEKEYEDGTLVYRFPDSGILKTKYGMNYGGKSVDNYTVDPSGNRAKLFYTYNGSDLDKIDEGEPYLYFGFTQQGGSTYPEVFAIVMKEKGKEDDLEVPDLTEFLASEIAKKEASNKSSQTIPAKRPLFQNGLNEINPQPTRKPS